MWYNNSIQSPWRSYVFVVQKRCSMSQKIARISKLSLSSPLYSVKTPGVRRQETLAITGSKVFSNKSKTIRQVSQSPISGRLTGFQTTYEGLKISGTPASMATSLGFQTTYEGLKLLSFLKSYIHPD